MGNQSYAGILPDQGGRKIHTIQRSVLVGGVATNVEEQYVVTRESERIVSGRYFFNTGLHTILATAQTTTTGFWYLFNPSGSAVLAAVRRVSFRCQLGSVLATPTAPRFAIARITAASGDLSASLVTPAKQDSTYAANTVKVSTAITGLTTPAAGAVAMAFLPVASATAVGFSDPAADHWEVDPAYPLILRASEGIYLQQVDNGTTSDTRVFTTGLIVDEFSFPS